jgi:hypothetical protein
MNESGQGPTVSWTDRLLLSVLFVAVTVVATYVAVAADGGPMFPRPLNELIFTVIGTTIVCLLGKRLSDLTRHRIERVDRRLAAIQSALVQHGVQLAEVTGEIPRIELPQKSSPGPRDEELNGYAKGYADGLSRKPISGNRVLPFGHHGSQGS